MNKENQHIWVIEVGEAAVVSSILWILWPHGYFLIMTMISMKSFPLSFDSSDELPALLSFNWLLPTEVLVGAIIFMLWGIVREVNLRNQRNLTLYDVLAIFCFYAPLPLIVLYRLFFPIHVIANDFSFVSSAIIMLIAYRYFVGGRMLVRLFTGLTVVLIIWMIELMI